MSFDGLVESNHPDSAIARTATTASRYRSRRLNRQDRRSRLVFLSPEGKRLALKLRGLHEEFEETLLRQLQESDLAKFERVIEVISEVTEAELRTSKQSQPSVKQGRKPRAG
jgi:hypothetical protein